MIVLHGGIIDFTSQSAAIPYLEVVVEKGSETHDLELEFMDLMGRIFQRINPALVVNMPETK